MTGPLIGDYIYILAAQHGGLRIGCFVDPAARCEIINRNKLINTEVVYSRRFLNYGSAVFHILIRLKEYELSHGWFSCPLNIAIAVVDAVGEDIE